MLVAMSLHSINLFKKLNFNNESYSDPALNKQLSKLADQGLKIGQQFSPYQS